jgi:hypothetical protein
MSVGSMPTRRDANSHRLSTKFAERTKLAYAEQKERVAESGSLIQGRSKPISLVLIAEVTFVRAPQFLSARGELQRVCFVQ